MNGVPSCANDWLLKDTARGEWGFDGYITADCDAVGDTAMKNFQPVPELAVAAALKAGTDNDCGKSYANHIPGALNKSFIAEADLDARLAMLWKVRLRLGHFDPVGPLNMIKPANTVCTDAAIATSQQGVIQSAALLKNVGKTLPLTAGTIGAAGAGQIAGERKVSHAV
jgi:beta-glucosidase-like glycosyl hydrolase